MPGPTALGLGLGGPLDHVADFFPRLLVQVEVRAPTGLVLRNRSLLQPASAYVSEEIVLRPGRSIEVSGVDARGEFLLAGGLSLEFSAGKEEEQECNRGETSANEAGTRHGGGALRIRWGNASAGESLSEGRVTGRPFQQSARLAQRLHLKFLADRLRPDGPAIRRPLRAALTADHSTASRCHRPVRSGRISSRKLWIQFRQAEANGDGDRRGERFNLRRGSPAGR